MPTLTAWFGKITKILQQEEPDFPALAQVMEEILEKNGELPEMFQNFWESWTEGDKDNLAFDYHYLRAYDWPLVSSQHRHDSRCWLDVAYPVQF